MSFRWRDDQAFLMRSTDWFLAIVFVPAASNRDAFLALFSMVSSGQTITLSTEQSQRANRRKKDENVSWIKTKIECSCDENIRHTFETKKKVLTDCCEPFPNVARNGTKWKRRKSILAKVTRAHEKRNTKRISLTLACRIHTQCSFVIVCECARNFFFVSSLRFFVRFLSFNFFCLFLFFFCSIVASFCWIQRLRKSETRKDRRHRRRRHSNVSVSFLFRFPFALSSSYLFLKWQTFAMPSFLSVVTHFFFSFIFHHTFFLALCDS